MDNKHGKTDKEVASFSEMAHKKEPTRVQRGPFESGQPKETERFDQKAMSEVERRRHLQNKRYRKAGGGRIGRPTASVKSSEQDRLIVNGVEMHRAKALRILGLPAYPMSSQITMAAEALLRKYHPENGGNPRKSEAVIMAQEILLKQQARILKKYQDDLSNVYKGNPLPGEQYIPGYQTRVQSVVDNYSRHADRQDNAARLAKIQSLGLQLFNIGTQFIKDLNNPKQDYQKLSSDYYKEYKALMDDKDLSTMFEPKEGGIVMAAMRSLYVDATRCDLHLPLGLLDKKAHTEDPFVAFKSKHQEYLADILDLGPIYPNYQSDLDKLYEAIESLGTQYMQDITQSGADLEKLSGAYAMSFKAAVDEAKIAFANEPSIWQNLNPCLRAIFTIIFVIKWCVYAAETEVDRHRMYNPDKFSIQKSWDSWEMDCMPELDIPAMKDKLFAGKGNL